VDFTGYLCSAWIPGVIEAQIYFLFINSSLNEGLNARNSG